MAWTQADLDAIEGALKTGTLRVRLGDRDIIYRSLDEMIRIRNLIAGDVQPLATGSIGVQYISTNKGLG